MGYLNLYDCSFELSPGTLPEFTAIWISDKVFLQDELENRLREEVNEVPTYYKVDRIIFHDPATIVFWTDGTKAVVKCMEGQAFSEYYGFLAALAKKIYGTNSAVERIVRQYSAEAKA